MINKIALRKNISNITKSLSSMDTNDRLLCLKEIRYKKHLLKMSDFNNMTYMPTLGKLRLVLEKEMKKEKDELDKTLNPSPNDFKRWALKAAVYDYYMELPYSSDVVAVDYEGDMTARRDNKEFDKTNVDLAPHKNDIYNRWMDKLSKLIRENKLDISEYDEAVDRGIPQGGAFEKQLDRYRKEFMNNIWQEYYQYYKL